MNLGVSSIPKRIESAGEGSDPSGESQCDKGSKTEAEHSHDKCFEKELELLAGHESSDDFDKSHQLQKTENTQGRHVLRGSDGEELHEGDLHGGDSSNDVPGGVSGVKSVVEPAHDNQNEGVQRNHYEAISRHFQLRVARHTVGDENVTTPCSDHPAIKQGSDHTPE